MKIALVHDFLTQDGGAERVLKVFSEMYPSAPIFTWFHDPKRVPYFADKKIHTTFLQKLPLAKQFYQWYLPLIPTANDSFDLSKFDVVLSSSSMFAKGVITRPETLNISYCHTPPRYLWTYTHDYVRELRRNFLVKTVVPFYLTWLRTYDLACADRVDAFIANSRNVAGRIKKYYRRESTIIHPPVDVQRFTVSDTIDNYFVAGGRLMDYKRFDIIIKAFNKLNVPLKIYGTGPHEKILRAMAKENIEFVGKVSDAERNALLSRCIAFINPQEEDWGITPIEAQASGRPVIAYAAGGNLETVVSGETGVFFPDQTWESLGETVIRFKPEAFSPARIRAHAEQFSVENFKRDIGGFVERKWEEFTTQNAFQAPTQPMFRA